MATDTRRGRLTVDLGEELHRRVKVVAAVRGETVRRFCIEAIQAHLKEAAAAPTEAAWPTEMTAAADPVLAQLWDNKQDAAYDRL